MADDRVADDSDFGGAWRHFPDVLETASIDGANGVQTFFRITIPLMKDAVWAATVDSLLPIPYYLFYYGFRCPAFKEYHFDDEKEYEVEVLDTWVLRMRQE